VTLRGGIQKPRADRGGPGKVQDLAGESANASSGKENREGVLQTGKTGAGPGVGRRSVSSRCTRPGSRSRDPVTGERGTFGENDQQPKLLAC